MTCEHGIYNSSSKDGDHSTICSRCCGLEGAVRSLRIEPVIEKVRDEIQHDKRMHPQENENDLIRGEYGTTDGVQAHNIRQIRKDSPQWALTLESIHDFLADDELLRREKVAYLYWACALPAREVADELKISQNAVEQIISRLKKLHSARVKKLRRLRETVGTGCSPTSIGRGITGPTSLIPSEV